MSGTATGRPRIGQRRIRIPRTREDAIELAGWAAWQLARGKLDPKAGTALMDMLKEFRAQLDGRDEDAKLATLREATEVAKQRQAERTR